MVAQYLVWSVDRMTEWSIQLMCYALIDQEGQCQINVPVVVYSEYKLFQFLFFFLQNIITPWSHIYGLLLHTGLKVFENRPSTITSRVTLFKSDVAWM